MTAGLASQPRAVSIGRSSGYPFTPSPTSAHNSGTTLHYEERICFAVTLPPPPGNILGLAEFQTANWLRVRREAPQSSFYKWADAVPLHSKSEGRHSSSAPPPQLGSEHLGRLRRRRYRSDDRL